jgi:ABC-type multidrug transport system ATPase subunit
MDINDKTELLININTNRDSNHYIHWNNIGLQANISGYCQCGELFIFIGDNENCKSILKTLYMNEYEERELDVSFNGRIYRNPLAHSSYLSITDIDNLYDNVTVMETLKFTESMCDIARKNKTCDQTTRLDHVIGVLKVDPHYINKYVCDLNNIEKWKLILACEILADMNILYIEDPTQNLNDEEKYEIISILRQFSLEGRFIFMNLININDILSQKKYLDLISRIQILSSTGSYIFGNTICITAYLAKYDLLKSGSFSNSSFSKVLVETNQQEFYGKQLETVFIKPSTSLVTWHFENSKELNYKNIIKESEAIIHDLSLYCYVSIFYYCLIRAYRTRIRDYKQLIILNGFSGIIASGGLLFTFYNQKNDLYGFQNVSAFLSIAPYGVILLGNLWYHSDYMDRKLFIYERTKKYLNHTFIFPISTVIADILVMRILPVLISTAAVYDGVGLNSKISSRINYLVTMICLMVTTAYFSRCVAIWFIFWFDLEGKAMAMTLLTGVLCLWTLYAGFVLNLDSLPSTKYFARDFSIFYWVS